MAKDLPKFINKRTIGYTIYMIIIMLFFVYAGHLFQQFEPNPQPLVAEESKITVNSDGVNLRSEASLDSEVVYQANGNEELTLLGYDGYFYHIKTTDGTQGYAVNWLVSSESNQLANYAKLAQKHLIIKNPPTIIVDAGHGGKDPGAISEQNLYEKEVTLSTAQSLTTKLENIGINVINTRSDDSSVSLDDRTAIANENAADYFFSIHYDASETSTDSGTTTYFYNEDESYRLAEMINPYIIEYLPLSNNGIRFGDYEVIRETEMPGLLFELGYMSNTSDVAAFSDPVYQDKASQAIFDAFITKLWVEYFPTVPATYQHYTTGILIILAITSIIFYALHYMKYKYNQPE